MKKLHRTFLGLVLLGFVIWWIYLDRMDFVGELHYAAVKPWMTVGVIALTYLTDNLARRVGSFMLVTNVVGVAAGAFTIGWRFASLLPVLVFLRITRREAYGWSDRLRVFSNYVFTYYFAGAVTELIPREILILVVFTYLLAFRTMNWLLVDVVGHGKLSPGFSPIEWFLSILLVPSYYAIATARTDLDRFVFFALPLITLIAILEFLRIREKVWWERESRKRLESVNRDLERLVEMMKLIRSAQDPEKVLSRVAELIAQTFGYRYALINIFNYAEDRMERIASYGIGDEDFERLKENAPTISEMLELMKPEYRVSKSYFIPEGAEPIDEETVFYGFYNWNVEEKDAWRPQDIFIVPINRPSGEMIGYISLDAPISGRRPKMEEIRMVELAAEIVGRILEDSMEYIQVFQRAQRDSLTGLLNHSAFYERLEKAVRSGNPFSIAIMDLDNFKEINDTYGHLVGDEILRRVSKILKESLRESDVIARYGGDEFAMILAGTAPQKALEILDRIRVKIEKADLLGIRVSVSIGVSGYPDDGTDPVELVEKADAAMYKAKALGKGKAMMSEEVRKHGTRERDKHDEEDSG